MVGNPCLPSVVSINEAVRLWIKLDCHVHAGPILCTDTAGNSSSLGSSWRPVIYRYMKLMHKVYWRILLFWRFGSGIF